MGAAGRNIVKVVAGTAIGAGVAALLSKVAERSQTPPTEKSESTQDIAEQAESFKDRLRTRWEQAREAGELAGVSRKAELESFFREKVDDPTAFQRNGADTTS